MGWDLTREGSPDRHTHKSTKTTRSALERDERKEGDLTDVPKGNRLPGERVWQRNLAFDVSANVQPASLLGERA